MQCRSDAGKSHASFISIDELNSGDIHWSEDVQASERVDSSSDGVCVNKPIAVPRARLPQLLELLKDKVKMKILVPSNTPYSNRWFTVPKERWFYQIHSRSTTSQQSHNPKCRNRTDRWWICRSFCWESNLLYGRPIFGIWPISASNW